MAKILLVEDDKSLREIYGVRLMAEGYTITSAGDGEEALAVAIKERPDLIVSDVMMPKISGFDMLDILRSTTETKDIKVIMMTALSSEDQRARGEALGADRYLVKSQVGIEDVVRTVHDVLGDGVGGAVAAPTTPAMAAPQPVAAPMAPTPIADITPAPAQFAAPPAMAPAPVAAPVAPPVQVAPTAPAPLFDQPAPQPVAAPVFESAPITPPVASPAPAAMPAPVAPAAPIETPPAPVAAPVFAPAEPAAPIAPAFQAPAPTPDPTPAPAPAPAFTLPEPTAPFSSNPPAGLGDRIIKPLPSADSINGTTPTDIAEQMNQELNAHLQEQNAFAPAPAPQPQQYTAPPQPPVPPQPGI